MEKLISREEFLAARRAINERLERNRERLAQRTGSGALRGLIGHGQTLRERWASESLDRKRSILGAVFEYIDVLPADRGRRAFQSSRVVPHWRQ